MGNSRILNWVKKESQNSLTIFDLRLRGIVKLRNLEAGDYDRLRPLLAYNELKDKLFDLIQMSRRLHLNMNQEDLELYPIDAKLKHLSKYSSKEIRMSRMSKVQICEFKIGLVLSPTISRTWLSMVKKLTSVKHRNTILRAAHAEVYSRERLHRFGLATDQFCEQCGEVETVKHKLFECERVANLWAEVNRVTDTTLVVADPTMDVIHRNFGAFLNVNRVVLTLNAELLTILMGNLQGIPEPRPFIKNLIKNLIRKEGHRETKEAISEILSNY